MHMVGTEAIVCNIGALIVFLDKARVAGYRFV